MNKYLLPFLVFALYSQVLSQAPPPPGTIPSMPVSASTAPATNHDPKTAPPMGGIPGEDATKNAVQVQALTMKPVDWDCTVEFYNDATLYYTEKFDSSSLEASRGKFSKKVENSIDEIYWSGSRCYCWVILYQSKYYQGLNLGFWTNSESGSYDLSEYVTYDFSEGKWERWSTTASSYSIYCY